MRREITDDLAYAPMYVYVRVRAKGGKEVGEGRKNSREKQSIKTSQANAIAKTAVAACKLTYANDFSCDQYLSLIRKGGRRKGAGAGEDGRER